MVLEATEIIRDPSSEVINHDIPVIAMTAHAMKGDRERCIQAGMNGYVSKPVEQEDLMELIDCYLLGKEPVKGEDNLLKDYNRSVFDWELLLNRMGGDEEFSKEILKDSLKIIQTRFEELKEAVNASDVKDILYLSHSIKGSFSTIAAHQLSEIALEIERCAMENKLNNLSLLMIKMSRALDLLQEFLKKKL